MPNQGEEGDIIDHNCGYGKQNHYIYNQTSAYGSQLSDEKILIVEGKTTFNSQQVISYSLFIEHKYIWII